MNNIEAPLKIHPINLLDNETIDRLNSHGLKLEVREYVDFYTFQAGDLDDEGIIAHLVPNGKYASQADDELLAVDDIIARDFLNNNEIRAELMDDDLIFRPVYDIGLGSYAYTVTNSCKTCDLNACGYVAMARSAFLSKFGLTHIDDDALVTLDNHLNRWLEKASSLATSGGYAYDISTHMDFIHGYYTNYKYGCNLPSVAISKTNELIKEVVKKIDESALEIEIEIDKSLGHSEFNPLGYINKILENTKGIKLVFGSMDKQGCTVSAKTAFCDLRLLKGYLEAAADFITPEFIQEWVNEVQAIKEHNGTTEQFDKEALLLRMVEYNKPTMPIDPQYGNKVRPELDDYLAFLRVLTKDVFGISFEKITMKSEPDVEYHNGQDVPF